MVSSPIAVAWLGLLLISPGCGSTEKEPPARTPLSVGVHEMSVVVPSEMELVDLGKSVELRTRGGWPGDATFERIVFQDLGPVRRNGEPLDSAAIDALGPSGLDSLAEASLHRLGHDGRFEVKERRALEVGGLPAVSLDTWYRSTHQTYRHVAIIRNGSFLLAVEAQQGIWEVVGKRFEDVLLSVAFGPQPPVEVVSGR